MIYLGLPDSEKENVVRRYAATHGINKIVLLHGKDAPYLLDADRVGYAQIILYIFFYRLLQEIDEHTLLIVDECLRTQNRYDLTYNCIRHYINRTPHVLVFQLLPQIDERDDFMILFDFVTHSEWKRRSFDADLIRSEAQVETEPLNPRFTAIAVPTSSQTQQKYTTERERLFAGLGARDPHTLPRNLYLLGGADKKAYISASTLPLFTNAQHYVARNKRLGLDCVVTYSDAQPGRVYQIVELPHRFIEFADFVYITRQTDYEVLCADLKVDRWYLQRYIDWGRRLHETYASL